jgi:tRNA(Arg) A34 adenosine deaminase TadA
MGTTDPKDFMQMALKLAVHAGEHGETPIAAVLVQNETVLAAFGNEIVTKKDPTAHAEMQVLRKAAAILAEVRLTDCDLYVTLEPCPMCAQAISFARIRRLYFGAYDPKGGGVEHGPKIFEQPTCHHKPEIIGGLQEGESAKLLKTFFQEKRD